MIREAKSKDAKAIASIYNHYILNSAISFEEKPINENIIIERINSMKRINGGFMNLQMSY